MVLRPILRPIQRKILRLLIAAAQRIFITPNGVDEYFTFQNTKTFPDDFDLSIDAVLPTAATTVTLFGQTASADHYIKVLSTGFASINIDTSVVTSTVLATKDNKQRRYGVKVVGDDFIFTEDGATIDTVTDAVAAAKTLIINVIAQSNGADFFNNTLSDPILTDLTTASNSVAWQLNRALPATTEQSTDGTNLLTYVGAPATELFTLNQSDKKWNGSIDLPSQSVSAWAPARGNSTIGGSTGIISATSTSTAVFGSSAEIDTIIGSNYTVIATVSKNTGPGTMRLRVSEEATLSANVVDIQSSTTINAIEDFTATTSPMFLGTINTGHDEGDIVTISKFSVTRFIEIA